jgi:hypothetical protein
MYRSEGSRQVNGRARLGFSCVEMKLDNLAGFACDAQMRGIKLHRFLKGPANDAGVERLEHLNEQGLPLVALLFRGVVFNGSSCERSGVSTAPFVDS